MNTTKQIQLPDDVQSIGYDKCGRLTGGKSSACGHEFSMKHHLDDCKQTDNPSTPAQAHSPLPWRVCDIAPYSVYSERNRVSDCREANCVCYTERDAQNAAFIVRACNNAERLADALRDLCDFAMSEGEYLASLKNFVQLKRAGRIALAQWEGGKQ